MHRKQPPAVPDRPQSRQRRSPASSGTGNPACARLQPHHQM